MKFCDKAIQDHLLRGGRIRRKSDKFPMFFNEEGKICYSCSSYIHEHNINKKELAADDWEIMSDEDTYNCDKIIDEHILCMFWDDGVNNPACFGRLLSIHNDANGEVFYGKILLNDGKVGYSQFKHFKPFNLSEYKIMENEVSYLK